jgi:spermidine/putrescine transport system substrate-binding protein
MSDGSRTSARGRKGRLALAAVGAVILVLAGCPAADEPAETADRLTILEWAGYELEELRPGFSERHPDVELDFQFGDSDPDFLTKVEAGGVEPHVVHPCAEWVGLWVDRGLAHPIDTGLLEHYDSLDPAMSELGVIDGEVYFVPFDWGYNTMIVATDRVDEVPTSWRDLWDPQYHDRIAPFDDAETAIVRTAYAWGIDPYDMTDEEFEEVRERLAEFDDAVKTYWTAAAELNALMIEGEVDIGLGWQETYAALLDADVEAEFVEPEEGRLGWVCGFIVTADPDTPEYDLAHDYIDAAIAPDAGVFLVNEYFYGHANIETLEVADPDVVQLMELDRLDIRERTNFFEPISDEQRELWTRTYIETTTR